MYASTKDLFPSQTPLNDDLVINFKMLDLRLQHERITTS